MLQFFQAKMYVILACAHEIQFQGRPEEHVSICSDRQAALEALQAIRTSPLVQQCQKALHDISTQHAVGLYWVPGHAGVQGNEITDEFARGGSALKFLGPEPALGVSRQVIRRIRLRLVDHHWVWWRVLCNTQRQAPELISGPSLGSKARFLSCNRTQSRVVTGLFTGYNALRRYRQRVGLSDSSLCRRCGEQDETSAHILSEREAMASLSHTYLGTFFWDRKGH